MALTFVSVMPLWWTAEFIAFHFFGIQTIWPVNWINNLKNDFRVMFNDLVVAIFRLAST